MGKSSELGRNSWTGELHESGGEFGRHEKQTFHPDHDEICDENGGKCEYDQNNRINAHIGHRFFDPFHFDRRLQSVAHNLVTKL